MGAGKSTIGRKLARRLGRAFFDTDDLIVRTHGSVAAIFTREGEATFRQYEREVIASVLSGGEAGVVALGGGALTSAANRDLLKKAAHSIFLKVPPERILQRVTHSREPRPLLGRRPTLAQIHELYDARLPYYASADHVVETEHLSDGEVLDDILLWLSERKTAPAR